MTRGRDVRAERLLPLRFDKVDSSGSSYGEWLQPMSRGRAGWQAFYEETARKFNAINGSMTINNSTPLMHSANAGAPLIAPFLSSARVQIAVEAPRGSA